MDKETKRAIILDHFQHPIGQGLFNDDSYKKVNINNESCIDEINMMVKLENGIIKENGEVEKRCGQNKWKWSVWGSWFRRSILTGD